MSRKVYPSDMSDEKWAFVTRYLTLVREDAPQREYALRDVVHALHWVVHAVHKLLRVAVGKDAQPTAAIFAGRTLHYSIERGERQPDRM